MIGIPLGLLYSNGLEWWIHKHILHGLGKSRKSFWSFHWHDHHAAARKFDMVDDQYRATLLEWAPQTKELAALGLGALVHLPLLPVAPFFTATVLYCGVNYYLVHRRAHLDHEWAKENLPWHFDHHMGRDQNANWCVTKPWADIVLGTRKKYLYGEGVPKELPETRSAAAQLVEALKGEWKHALARKADHVSQRAQTAPVPVIKRVPTGLHAA
jgi:hypothetical protein